jgi:hypothetical protein
MAGKEPGMFSVSLLRDLIDFEFLSDAVDRTCWIFSNKWTLCCPGRSPQANLSTAWDISVNV